LGLCFFNIAAQPCINKSPFNAPVASKNVWNHSSKMDWLYT